MNNRFVFIVPCYNAEKTIERMLMSVFMQTYDNWLILIRDDMSTDRTIDKIEKVCENNSISYDIKSNVETQERSMIFCGHDIRVIANINDEKFWEVRNVLEMIKSDHVKEDDILLRLDGDDFLCDLCALGDLNKIYKESGADCIWTAHRWQGSGRNISGPMEQNADPYAHPWVSSHLKTFRKNLITNVPDENFRGEDGEYIKRAGDQAIYLPVLYNAKKRGFFPKVTYFYSINDVPETYQTDDSKFQLSESQFIRSRGYISEGSK